MTVHPVRVFQKIHAIIIKFKESKSLNQSIWRFKHI